MSVALDVGTAAIKSLRREGPRLIFRQVPSVYAAIPHSQQIMEQLQADQLSFAFCRDQLILIGESAEKWGDLNAISPLFPQGRLRTSDILERQILAKIIEGVLPAPRSANEICCLNLPQNLDEHDQVLNLDQHFLLNLVELRGYQPLLCNSGMAIVLAECETSSYTGLGVSFGKQATHVSLMKNGRQIRSGSIPIGGDWLDGKLLQNHALLSNYWDPNQIQNSHNVQLHREAFQGSLLVPVTLFEQVLSDLTQELLNVVMQELQRLLQGQAYERTFRSALPVVCAGGLTLMNDFLPLMQMLWEKYPLPFEISSFRRARQPMCCICQGGLINAELETLARRQQGAA